MQRSNFCTARTTSPILSSLLICAFDPSIESISVMVNTPYVLAFLASLLPRNAYLMMDRQDSQRLPLVRKASKLSRFIILIFCAIICLTANAETTSSLQSSEPISGVRNGRRELVASSSYSFTCTGAVETWYYFTFLCPLHLIKCNYT